MNDANEVLARLTATIRSRKGADPQSSYIAGLFAKPDAILKKVGEETAELIVASKNGEPDAIVHEATDLLFHVMIALAHHGLSIDDVMNELARREGTSGIVEKQRRKD
jgi:phosphoribosyl-ATP pyrophosphohydrolase